MQASKGQPFPLGATPHADGVNIAVSSEIADAVEVCLFDSEGGEQRVELPGHTAHIWHGFLPDVQVGQRYGLRVQGPWNPGEGLRCNPAKLLLDPHATAVDGEVAWGEEVFGHHFDDPDACNDADSAAAMPKCVVTDRDFDWSGDRRLEVPLTDTVIYETHVKGLTKRHPEVPEEIRGTYAGLAHPAITGYLTDLGVTAVELLPVHQFVQDSHLLDRGLRNYWGYNSIGFLAPHGDYSSAGTAGGQVDEFKAMVKALHAAGLEVILDVVYNHTGEGGLWRSRRYIDNLDIAPGVSARSIEFAPNEVANVMSFRGLDNAAYYALSEDNQEFWNNTGVGNGTRPNHTPMRRLILDSLHFYVEELHVDGFRFDLAAILGEKDRDYNAWDDPANTVLQDIIDDPVLLALNTRIIAEPWSAHGSYGPLPLVGTYPCARYGCLNGAYPASTENDHVGWYEWNADFRHWWRSFVNFDNWKMNSVEGPADGGFTMTGSEGLYGWNGRRPYHSINYITAHDGFTMYDLVSFNEKQNACGPLNSICCDAPASPWCEIDSGDSDNRSRDWGQDNEALKRQLMRNWFLAMMISHGTPMLLGGDEWMRTQFGNNNAYSTGADNEWNWFRWGEWRASKERTRMHDFVRQVIRFRKEHAYAFSPAAYDERAPFAWKDTGNNDKTTWDNRTVMVHYWDASVGPELAILINMERDWVEFTLAAERTWHRLIDTQEYFETRGPDDESTGNVDLDGTDVVPDATYRVPGSTMVVLRAE